MKMMKVRMMIAAILTAAAAAAWGADSDFIFDAATGTITKYTGWDTELVIPGTIGGTKVTAIGEDAFKGGDLTSVTIPAGVLTIKYGAFEGNKLASLTLPEGLKTIERRAFAYNNIASLSIPGSLERIESETFKNNKLTSLVIPEGVEYIADNAFIGNQTESLSLPSSLEYVNTLAFAGAFDDYQTRETSRSNIAPRVTLAAGIRTDLSSGLGDVNKKGEQYYVLWYNYIANGLNAGTYTTDMPCVTKKSGNYTYVQTQYGAVIISYTNRDRASRLRIPADFEGAAVTAIATGGFGELDNILLPEGLRYIGAGAFNTKKLASLTIPASVNYIGKKAFAYGALESLTILTGTTCVIDTEAFYSNKLKELTLSSGLIYIGNQAFNDNDLAAVTIPDSVTYIGNAAFNYAPSIWGDQKKVSAVTIGANVEIHGGGSFGKEYNENGKKAGVYTYNEKGGYYAYRKQ
jgi:hypothetical protein